MYIIISSDGCVLFKYAVKDVGAGLACATGSHTYSHTFLWPWVKSPGKATWLHFSAERAVRRNSDLHSYTQSCMNTWKEEKSPVWLRCHSPFYPAHAFFPMPLARTQWQNGPPTMPSAGSVKSEPRLAWAYFQLRDRGHCESRPEISGRDRNSGDPRPRWNQRRAADDGWQIFSFTQNKWARAKRNKQTSGSVVRHVCAKWNLAIARGKMNQTGKIVKD